jgi:hypothetical protein
MSPSNTCITGTPILAPILYDLPNPSPIPRPSANTTIPINNNIIAIRIKLLPSNRRQRTTLTRFVNARLPQTVRLVHHVPGVRGDVRYGRVDAVSCVLCLRVGELVQEGEVK